MKVSCDFDGGSIEVVSEDADDLVLGLRRDTGASYRQWFYFTLHEADELTSKIVIEGADEASYPTAWEDYRAFGSYGGKRWFRVPTSFDGQRLIIDHEPDRDEVSYAYFVPYSLSRHERLIERASSLDEVAHLSLGESVEGRPIDMLLFGDEDAETKVWVTARQHPGETMAEHFAEGLIKRLCRRDDPLVAALLERACFYVIPNMNPDGSTHGNLRANAAGVNLNRVWDDPDEEDSPEVLAVRAAMIDRGVDMLLDVHGDEQYRYCFVSGAEGNPGYSRRIASLEQAFVEGLLAESADFQDDFRYERDPPGEGDLSIANNWVGERFDCLSLVLEMPFKDLVDDGVDDMFGWTPKRSKKLARAVLRSLPALLPRLR